MDSGRQGRKKRRRRAELLVRTVCVLAVVTAIVAVSAVTLALKHTDVNGQEQDADSDYVTQQENKEFDTGLSKDNSLENQKIQPAGEEAPEVTRNDPADKDESFSDQPAIPVEDDKESEKAAIPSGEATEEEVKETEKTALSSGESAEEEIEKLINEMSLHDKICQMMLVTPEALTGVGTATAAGQKTKEAMNEYPVGGVILFAKNLENGDQTTAMISNLQKYGKEQNGIGLFISVDEEGGKVARVANNLGTTKLKPMFEYREQGLETAYDNAAVIAKDISQFGFNLDFAPVADTWSNPKNMVIGDRAYSDDYETVARLVSSAVEGFHSENIMCTLKHFPGHGDTEEDSHMGTAYVYKTLDELRMEEFLPFQAGISAGADMVMVGHITLPELDTLPASLSSVIITNILRGELEYDGVVITDSLSMKALTDLYGVDRIAVMAVQAGNDLLLCQTGMKSMVSALENAVASGEISEERIDQSVRRILTLKYRYGLLGTERF